MPRKFCPWCPLSFRNEAALGRHLKRAMSKKNHRGPPRFDKQGRQHEVLSASIRTDALGRPVFVQVIRERDGIRVSEMPLKGR